VARTHLAITVELVHGVHTGDLWPRPGRVLIAARSTMFEQLGRAIDDAFARWDHSHLHEFTLADGTLITPVRWWDGEEPEGSLDGAEARLGRLRPGEQFAYTFDLGDNWQHLCTVATQRADPLQTLGIMPDKPLPCWGWGDIPDQYGRRWDGDDGSSPMPKASDGLAGLPPILPGWGPRQQPRSTASPADGSAIRYRDLTTKWQPTAGSTAWPDPGPVAAGASAGGSASAVHESSRRTRPPARPDRELYATAAHRSGSAPGRKARWVMKEAAPCGRSNPRRPARPEPGHADARRKTYTTDPVLRASAPGRP